MFGIKLHWWIFIGIAVGVSVGWWLHVRYFDRIEREGRLLVVVEEMAAAREALDARAQAIRQPEEELVEARVRARRQVLAELPDVEERIATVEPQLPREQVRRRAISEVLGITLTVERERALTRLIQSRQDALLRNTVAGGTVDGIARLFMNLLRMIVLPLVVASLICGVTGMGDPKRLGRLGGMAGIYYICTSLLAILTGLLLVNVLRPGVGVELPIPTTTTIATPDSFWEVVLNMVPANFLQAAVAFDLFPVIFFSLLFGIFTLMVREELRAPVIAFFSGVFEIMMKMTLFILALAPIGVAALIARLVALSGPAVFWELRWYVGAVALALVIHFAVVLPLLFFLLTRRNPFRMMRAMSPALLTAFSTASSAGTLPLTLNRLENNVGVRNKVSGFVAPLGATVNMDGTALYEIVATLFVAQMYAAMNPDFTLTFAQQIVIVVLALTVSIGAAGIPSAGLVMMVIIFTAVGLPVELTALLWAVDRVLDMARTTVNVWSDAVGAATIAHFEGEIDDSVLFSPTADPRIQRELLVDPPARQ